MKHTAKQIADALILCIKELPNVDETDPFILKCVDGSVSTASSHGAVRTDEIHFPMYTVLGINRKSDGNRFLRDIAKFHSVALKDLRTEFTALYVDQRRVASVKGPAPSPVPQFMPKAGDLCEYTAVAKDVGHESITPGIWYRCKVVAFYNGCVWTSDNGIRLLNNTLFREIKTDEERFIEKSIKVVASEFGVAPTHKVFAELYKAGARYE